MCVKKGNQELLNQVNDAIGKINQANPSLQNELENKYYGTDSGDEVAFTEEERAYVNELAESGRKLKVMINPDRAPLSFYEEGQMSGIFGAAANKVLERSGLPFEVVEVKDRSEYKEYREKHLVDLCMDLRFDYNEAEAEGYRITDSYNSASISRMTRENFTGDMKSIAAVENSDIAWKLQEFFYGDAAIVYYDTVHECVDAVRDGKQDATYMYTYVAENYLKEDVRHQLSSNLIPDFTTDFCIGIGDTGDAMLFSILNKSVESIEGEWLDQQTVLFTESDTVQASFTDLIYTHPMAVIIVIGVMVVLLAAVVLMLYRQRMQRKDEERAKEIQRLFDYVCRANEKVMEINLNSMRCKEYYFEGPRLCISERDYRTEGNFKEFMHPDDYKEVEDRLNLAELDEIIRNGSEYVFEARSKSKDGVYRWYIFTIHGMVPDSLHPCNFMLFKRDINDLKEKEEEGRKALMDALQVAKEASEAKGSFMSRMSHEIRTPLNAVIGYLTLSEDCLEEPVKVGDYIGKCQSAAKHLLNIINDVLDISAIESGKIKIASEEFDLKELLTSVTLMFYNQAKEKGIDFQVAIRDMSDELVVGDQLRLNQILMNLLSNAMKFTPKGGTINLSVVQLQTEEKHVRFRFEVADTGIGMSKSFMSRIFSPFEQEKAETARRFGGSGLGLSITSNLIRMMHGSIDVESEEGKGTTFTIHLVFGKAQKQRKEHAMSGDFSRIRALIVDDEKRSCDYMKALLKRCHVKSDMVLSGEDALKQIKRRQGTDYEYNICLIDWNMPGMDGVETARRIRQECGESMPLIIASAYDVNEIRDAATQAGVSRLIAKPLFQSSMLDLLVDTFGKYHPEMELEFDNKKIDFSGIRVLLVEDNEMNREIAVTILKKSGLVIDTAVDGKDAYDKFVQSDQDTYQVILMDIQMPIMDGHEATKAIRASAHPQAKTVPILAMTANAFTEDVTAALASGMNDHVAKPINYDKLYDLLTKYVVK